MKEALQFFSSDPILAPLTSQWDLRPIVPSSEGIYEQLLESIVSQQLSIKAADTIYGRFLDLFPERIPDPEKLLLLDPAVLRSAWLSGQKSRYLREVAKAFLEKDLLHRDFHTLSDEEIIKTLTAITWVGVWTVHMLLIFTLGRPDVFAYGDGVVRQSMVRLFWLTETWKALEKRINEIALAWSPYRSTACRLLWRFKDNG